MANLQICECRYFVFAAVKVFEDGQNEGAATFYDYDIHGNVEKLVQSLPELAPKTVEYDYDLLSGNVHRVTYQKGEKDQFMHRYTYDADNRLEAVFTSSDGYIWDQDARYLYYAHGPMARVELGEYKVQGVDYYYTLQGWIKGVNLQGDHDAEATNNVQKYVSKDAFGYALHYYQNDYQSITGNFGWNATGGYSDLFNGNIAAMSTTLKTAGEQTMFYQYDQLNRIKEFIGTMAFEGYYNYDANGNILNLTRFNGDGNEIDRLNYTYNTTQNNRLRSVNDVSGSNEGLESGSHTYTYDEIGNLKSDREISQINWTVYGKIESVQKVDGTQIEYKYDGTGQRIYKKVVSSSVSKETHYVRDGSGNVLAIYENKVIDELVIYGSSRLGSYNGKTDQGKRTLGNKKYELSNHLGNVLAVISDNKIGIGTNGIADYYEPLVISESDYYPFGMAMKERSFSNEEYRFGFNTQEKSTELGEDTYTAEFWQYDSKIARRWNVDPVVKFWESSYSCFRNNPLLFSDPSGLNGVPKKHTIEGGDTYWDLAESSNGAFTVNDLKKWNPNIDPSNLQIGSQINISNPNDNIRIGGGGGGAMKGDQGSYSEGRLPQSLDEFEGELAMTDSKLEGELLDALEDGTVLDLETVAGDLVNHFKGKSGTDYFNKTLNKHINEEPQFQNLIANIRRSFQAQMILNNGNYSDINLNMASLPNFSFGDPQLLTLVGGTQQLDIYLTEIFVNENGTFSAVLKIDLIDTFGVDEEDTGVLEVAKSFKDKNLKKRFAYTVAGEGLKAMWVLQHNRGYKPFRNFFKHTMIITGKYK